MAIFKCKMCGGDIELSADKTFGTCECCGTSMTFPKVSDEQRLAMFNRGNAFRRAGEFDKALALYENILREDDTDAEAHWCCALCRFGIEYVEDPATMEYIPTCHRASFDSFLDDMDYKAAVENAEGLTKRQYQKDALRISDVQKRILATSQNEEPFDVFICYKETDDSTGQRTRDSIDAQEIYYQLTNEGYRVFFSRITLEGKTGAEYEPYIFAALNSSKVMVVIGSKTEYFNAVWVKNEWSRFLAMMRKDRKKLLLPCYRDISPYDLPEQLSVLQSYDMSKIGFIQDLIRGIGKIVSKDEPKPESEVKIIEGGSAKVSSAPLLKRAFIFLEDSKWAEADEYCEKVLDLDPENGRAYLGKLMAELKVRTEDKLKDVAEPFADFDNAVKASRFDSSLAEKLKADNEYIRERNENARKDIIYKEATEISDSAIKEYEFIKAKKLFETISGFKDADEKAQECAVKADKAREDAELAQKEQLYNNAVSSMNSAKSEKEFKKSAYLFDRISGFKDSDVLLSQCLEKAETAHKNEVYGRAILKLSNNTIKRNEEAIKLFESIIDWKDSRTKIDECNARIADIKIAEEKAEAERKRKAEEARIAAEKAKARNKKIAMTVGPIAAVLLVFIIVLNTVIIPKQKLNKAMDLLNAGNYDEAYSQLAKLGETDTINGSKYDRAVKLAESGDYETAFILFEQCSGYKDADKKSLSLAPNYYKEKFSGIKTGDIVKFGNYYQTSSTVKEEIEWRVLKVKDGKALIISEKALDCQQYNTEYTSVTWETCSLRKWLNETFINDAFNSNEQTIISETKVTADANPSYSTSPGKDTTDKVFPLGITEAEKYLSFNYDRRCVPTKYAIENGAYTSSSYEKNSEATCWWWLRSPGYDSDYAARVDYDGGIYRSGDHVNSWYGCIRPALWIEIG